MWLGIIDNIDGMLVNHSFSLDVGDTLFLYTDGITEAIDSNEKMYTDERLFRFLEKNGDLSADALKNAIIADLEPFAKLDDVTFVILKRISK